VRQYAAASLAEVEKATLRLLALRTSRNMSVAASRLGMAAVSLSRWLGRRKLPPMMLSDPGSHRLANEETVVEDRPRESREIVHTRFSLAGRRETLILYTLGGRNAETTRSVVDRALGCGRVSCRVQQVE
jgi:hypothetical protein